MEVIFSTPNDADYSHTFNQVHALTCMADTPVANGRFLAGAGLPMAALNPEHALLLEITPIQQLERSTPPFPRYFK